MDVRVLKPGEKIPEGSVRVHLYPVTKVLAPRGSMKKESLGEDILEALNSCYESWTDEKYGDNPSKRELLSLLKQNLDQEVRTAWFEFVYSKSLK
jgi:hypothetical protein